MILVADDSPDDCELFRRSLLGAGYTVYCSRTARDALQVLQTMTPGLLVVDLYMPDMDGFELLRQVRDRPGIKGVSILVHTVSDSPADRDRAMQLGANDFVTKGSLTPDELRQRVRRLYPKP